MTKTGEQRRHARTNAAGRVSVGWTDAQGIARMVLASCVDTSAGGIKVLMKDELAFRSTVYVRGAALSVDQAACVRYCRRKGTHFEIGLEFTCAPRKRD